MRSPGDVRQRVAELANRPSRQLPVPAATVKFAPSAVLALLGTVGSSVGLVFTRRADGLRTHGGDICLPGGRLENDETVAAAAVREACEELTVSADGIEIGGILDQAYTGAPSLVTPVVA